MVNKKKKKSIPAGTTFDIELAYLMADEYLKTADRVIKNIPEQKGSQERASIYVAISSLSFAIEVYLKSILFTHKKEAKEGHDLENLWDSLPKPIQTCLSDVFDKNFDSESEKWAYYISFTPLSSIPPSSSQHSKFLYKPSQIQIPENTAIGMIKGHRLAFLVGRYAYEQPPLPILKKILFNLDGLQLVAWLTRALALHEYEVSEMTRKTGKTKDLSDQLSETINFPENIEKFPQKESMQKPNIVSEIMGELRLSYLCTQAARGRITLDEWSELIGYIALDPQVWDYIAIEVVLRNELVRTLTRDFLVNNLLIIVESLMFVAMQNLDLSDFFQSGLYPDDLAENYRNRVKNELDGKSASEVIPNADVLRKELQEEQRKLALEDIQQLKKFIKTMSQF